MFTLGKDFHFLSPSLSLSLLVSSYLSQKQDAGTDKLKAGATHTRYYDVYIYIRSVADDQLNLKTDIAV